MVFSTKFFVVAAIFGVALAGITIDPALLNLVSQLDYRRLLNPQYRTISISLAVGVGLIGLRQYWKGRNRRRGRGSRPDPESYSGSHPFHK